MSKDEEFGTDEGDALLGSNGEEKTPSRRLRFRSLFSFLDRGTPKRRRHHRRESSVMKLITEGFEGVGEDVQASVLEVREAFVEELREADRGDVYFLDMNLTRSLSVPPDDLRKFLKETTSLRRITEEEPLEEAIVEEEKVKPTGLPLLPLLSLLAAVLAVSSNGTALSLQKGAPPSLKLYWRMTATAAGLAFFAFKGLWYDGWPKLTGAQWITFGMAVGCFVFQNLAFVNAIQYTSIGNAVIFANSQALLLLAGKAFIGTPILCMEGSGAFVAFAGAMLCASGETTPPGIEDSHALSLAGDILALFAALGGVGYLTFAKSVRHTMCVTLFMFLVMVSGSFLVLAYMLITREGVSFSMDVNFGLFGWLNWRFDRLATELWVVFVCNMTGTMGFLNAMQHFENLVIAVATLLEPMVASLIAYALKVGELPGPIGWMGNVLVVIGTIGVVYPSVNSGDGGGH